MALGIYMAPTKCRRASAPPRWLYCCMAQSGCAATQPPWRHWLFLLPYNRQEMLLVGPSRALLVVQMLHSSVVDAARQIGTMGSASEGSPV